MWKPLRSVCLCLVLFVGCSSAKDRDPTMVIERTTTTTQYIPINWPTTSTTVAPPTTTTTESTYQAASSVSPDGIWDVIAECETPPDGNWGARGGLYEGGLQFSPGTWRSYVAAGKPYGLVNFPQHAYDATREQQITVAIRIRDGVKGSSDPYLNPQGYGAWPTCRHAAGV